MQFLVTFGEMFFTSLSTYLPSNLRAFCPHSFNALVLAIAKASELVMWFGGVILVGGLRGREGFFQLDAFTNWVTFAVFCLL